jgi:hypothetical protein
VILLCDEDIGTKVPTALSLVGYDVRSIHQMGWSGKPDTWWLAEAGRLGWLVFSCNTRMLRVPLESSAIQDNQVGIIYLTSGEQYLPKVLWLLLVKWPWLQDINRNLPRPFARFLSPTGRVTDSYRRLKL